MLPGSGHILHHWPQGTPLGTLIPKPAQDNKGPWRASTPAPPQRKGHTLGGHVTSRGCLLGLRKHRGEAEAVTFMRSVSFVIWGFLTSPSKPNDWGSPRESSRDWGLVDDSAGSVSLNTHCLPLKAFRGTGCAGAARDSGVHCTWRGTQVEG